MVHLAFSFCTKGKVDHLTRSLMLQPGAVPKENNSPKSKSADSTSLQQHKLLSEARKVQLMCQA